MSVPRLSKLPAPSALSMFERLWLWLLDVLFGPIENVEIAGDIGVADV